MKTFVLVATAVGILTSALAASATAKPNATGGTIKSPPVVSTDRSGAAKPSNNSEPIVSTDRSGTAKPSKPSPKLEYFTIELKDVMVTST